MFEWLKNQQPAQGKLQIIPEKSFHQEKLIEHLSPKLQYFANSFYEKFQTMLPQEFYLAMDKQAPDDAKGIPPKDTQGDPNLQKLSVEYKCRKGSRSFKYGTARVELRDNHFFIKLVTWHFPLEFLFERAIYEHIKLYYPHSTIMRSKSKSGRGFAIKNKKHIITLEVFENQGQGFLACDQTLNANNKPLAKERMEYFMEFYGALCNLHNNEQLRYQVKEKLPEDEEVEFIEDYQAQIEREAKEAARNNGE